MNIICYGDSNTFGYDPRSYLGGRYAPDCRWVDILAAESGWNVRNNSMNGRQIPKREIPVPKSTDLLIIMLGTNDILQGCSPEQTAQRMGAFLDKLTIPKEKILLVSPPPMKRGEWVTEDRLIRDSLQLAQHYQIVAGELGTCFADSGAWNLPLAFDGVHITEEGNKIFAKEILTSIKMHLCL